MGRLDTRMYEQLWAAASLLPQRGSFVEDGEIQCMRGTTADEWQAYDLPVASDNCTTTVVMQAAAQVQSSFYIFRPKYISWSKLLLSCARSCLAFQVDMPGLAW